MPKKSCFLPARVVMALFRGKYLAYLGQAHASKALRLPEDFSPLGFHRLLNRLHRTKWNVHLQERYSYGEGVVKYVARYVRGGALKNTQIRKVSEQAITYRFSSHAEKGKLTEMTVSPEAFIRRYLQHVPEHRRQGVRSFGLYAHTQALALNTARASQDQAPLKRPPFLTWQAYYARLTGKHEAFTCPTCGAPLIARTPLPRRSHDPPLPLSSPRTAYA